LEFIRERLPDSSSLTCHPDGGEAEAISKWLAAVCEKRQLQAHYSAILAVFALVSIRLIRFGRNLRTKLIHTGAIKVHKHRF
jgi:hypothetical protein